MKVAINGDGDGDGDNRDNSERNNKNWNRKRSLNRAEASKKNDREGGNENLQKGRWSRR